MRTNRIARWLGGTMILVAAIAIIAAPGSAQQDLLRITSPGPGCMVRPGDTVTIGVSADYSVEKLALIGQHPLGVGMVLSGAAPGIIGRGLGEGRPMQFTLKIPTEIQPGIYRVTAIGRTSSGDVESQALTLDVEKPEPSRIWAEPTLLHFTRIGDRIPVRVLGAFADGSSDELTKSTRTSFQSANPSIATVSAEGIVTAASPGKTTITVRTPSLHYSIPVRVE
jgi:hypothetical protein